MPKLGGDDSLSTLHKISGCDDDARKADVVFIHGLGGNAFKTWSHSKDHKNSWPFWLGEAFPDVGVWSVEYAASISKWTRVLGWFSAKKRDAGYSMALPDRALELLDAMQLEGIGKRPILFICHSLGGLVAKQLLRKSHDTRDIAKHQLSTNIGAVLFLGTPHGGSFLATILDWARLPFLTTRSIDDLAAHSPYLADLNGWYREFAPNANIRTKTYYETRGAFGLVKVVNRGSSDSGVGEAALGLDKDHFSIAKPDSPTGRLCEAASTLLRDYVLQRATQVLALPPIAALTPTPPAPVVVTFNIDPKSLGSAHRNRPPCEIRYAAEKFFGRIAEKLQVTERLRRRKNTAIVGPAGFGKSALAADAVRDIVGDTETSLAASPFPDGVVFLDFYESHGSLIAVLGKLIASLEGEAFMVNSPQHDRAAAACRGKRILVTIEGGEEADGIGDHGDIRDLLNALAPENCWLLLTRLSTQSAAEKSVALKDALDETDAAALLDSLTQGRVTADVRTRVLALLEGHPLAITWAGNLLARGDEDPARLTADWVAEKLPTLTDPENASRTLEWLFNRSVRGLDDTAKRALAAAGLLARAPFPLEAIAAALGDTVDEPGCRDALRTLVQRGFLQLTDRLHRWQFVHVLGYRFARDERNSEAVIRLGLASWLDTSLKDALASDKALQTENEVSLYLEHVSALLRADFDLQLWYPLANEVLYDLRDRLTDLGRLGQVAAVLASVQVWMGDQWLRERSLLLHRQGDSRVARGDLAGALKLFQEAVDVRKTLADNKPFDTVRQRDLIMSHEKVGKVCLVQGDFTGALTAFQDSADMHWTVAESDPSNAAWQRDLSASYDKVGDVCFAQHDMVGALNAFHVSMSIRKTMINRDPSNAEWQRDLRVSYDKVDDAHIAQDNLAEAVTAFQASIGVRKALVERDQSNIRWQRDLSLAFTRLALVHERLGERTSALEYAEQSLQIDERLAALHRNNATAQNDVKFIRAMVARLKVAAD